MAIERTVRGRIVPGVDGPVSAPSASFQDFTAYSSAIAVGVPVYWDTGEEELAVAEADTAVQCLGICYSLLNNICRVQTTGVYTHHEAALLFSEDSWVFLHKNTYNKNDVTTWYTASTTHHGMLASAGRHLPPIGYGLSAIEVYLTCGQLPQDLWKGVRGFFPSKDLPEEFSVQLASGKLFLTSFIESITDAPELLLAQTDGSISDGDSLGSVRFIGRDAFASGWAEMDDFEEGARVEAVAGANWSDTGPECSTALAFFTRTTGEGAPAERMRLDHDGQLGLGTENPEYAVHVMTGDSGESMIGSGDGLFLESNITSLGVTVAAPDAQAALCVLGIDASLTLKGATGNKYATIKMDGAADRLDVRGPNTEIYFGNSAEAKFAMHVRPSGDRDLGSGGARWRYLYVDDVFVNAEITATTVTAATTLTAEGTFTMEKAQYRLPTQVTFNADYEVLATDSDIVLLGAGGAYNVELPTGVAGQDGRVLTVSNLTAAAAKLELDSGAGDIWAMGTNSNKTLAVGERATIQGYWDSGSSRVVWVVTLDTYL